MAGLRGSAGHAPAPSASPSPAAWRRWAVWGGFALLLVLAPWLFPSGLGLTVLSQIGIAAIACLSYNLLLGQGGLLSFGHAVYSGMGAFLAMHALNRVGEGALALPVSLVPLVGGVAGLGLALLFGYVSTRRAGTTFAMITLGLGELVFALALMLPGFFGGEAGLSGDRVVGEPVLGISFGPQRQVYGLIALYTFVCVAALYAFTRAPLGRLLNAVRDNPERVSFIGYDPQTVRWLAFMVAGFFAGVSGGLGALHLEIVTAEVLGAARSGSYLLFTFLGGATVFFGPLIGAVLMVLSSTLLAKLTQAWLLYLGLVFVFMVMVAPGGIASLLLAQWRVAAHGRLRSLLLPYLLLAAASLPLLAGVCALIEMVYLRQLSGALDAPLAWFGLTLHTGEPLSWLAAAAVALLGWALARPAWRHVAKRWNAVQAQMQAAEGRGVRG